MKKKNHIYQNMMPVLLVLVIAVSGIVLAPVTVRAAGWLDYAQQTIDLGTAVSGSIKTGDYYGRTESTSYSSSGVEAYWHIYKFTMPKEGLLNIYLESLSESYLRYYYGGGADGFVIFPVSNPDDIVWRSMRGQNVIQKNYSASRAMYYGSTEIALGQGEYYFVVRQKYTNDNPYYLTLSYKEPVINVTSISLDLSGFTMETGSQKTINATVLPNNATDKTVLWKSTNPSVATVDNGTVKAITVGTASVIASSMDGEITAACTVNVVCPHDYHATLTPAGRTHDGSYIEECTKCGDIRENKVIYAISGISLSKTSYTYNGKAQTPTVTVKDTSGRNLVKDVDYTVSYTGNRKNVGIYNVTITFKTNYYGTLSKKFTIYPKSTQITGITSKKKGFSVKWNKQTIQNTGYELAYSTNKNFTKKNTKTVTINKSKTKVKNISKLKGGMKYYVRIRTYKTVKDGGKTTNLYSGWSKAKTVVTKS